MTLFELIKITLDDLYPQAVAAYGDETDQIVADRMNYLSQQYLTLNRADRTPIDYKDPATRMAYVHKYVTAHGDYIVQVLEELSRIMGGRIFSDSSVRLSCIGGGPGSDVIAALKFLSERENVEPVSKLTCYLVDGEQAWGDTWTELDDKLSQNLGLSTHFQKLDVTDPETWKYQRKFLDADLFTISFFVSEVKSLDGGGVVTEFWNTLFNEAKPGALILYIDNGAPEFNDYFDNLCNQHNVDCILERTNHRLTPSTSEEKSELSEYIEKFGQSPKLQGYISYRVLRKLQ